MRLEWMRRGAECPLSGVKRTLVGHGEMLLSALRGYRSAL
jgi:hypothetical protein